MSSNVTDERKPLDPKLSSHSYTNSFRKFTNFESNGRVSRMEFDKAKLALFAIFVYGMTFFGAGTSLIGLSLVNFSKNLNVEIEKASYGVTVASVSGCIGSLLASYTLDKVNRQTLYAIGFLVFAINYALFPFFTSLAGFLTNFAINGACTVLINVIPNVMIMEMFDSGSKIYLQTMHSFFPIGLMLGPMIYVPFVGEAKNSSQLNNLTQTGNTKTESINLIDDLFETTKYSNMWKPYLIVSLFQASVAVLTLIAFFVKPYRKSDVKKSDSNEEIEDKKNTMSKNYEILFTVLICIMTSIQLTNESTGINFIPTYLRKSKLNLDEVTASYCQGILSTSIAVGRMVNIFVTMKISSQIMLIINFVLMFSGNLLIMTIGTSSVQGVYWGVAILGYGFSNSFPMIISYVDERTTMTNRKMSLITLSGLFLISLSPFTIGRFLDTNPLYFIVLNICIISFAFVIFILIIILEHLRLNK